MSNDEQNLQHEMGNIRDDSAGPELPYKAWVRAFGVNVCIKSDSPHLLDDAVERAKKALAGNLEIVPVCSTPHEFGLFVDEAGTYVLRQDGNNSRNSQIRKYF